MSIIKKIYEKIFCYACFHRKVVEQYLADSQSMYDVERKQRELAQKGIL